MKFFLYFASEAGRGVLFYARSIRHLKRLPYGQTRQTNLIADSK